MLKVKTDATMSLFKTELPSDKNKSGFTLFAKDVFSKLYS